ncbi:MAG TPA: response regulator [Acetobacteraceae bacterium]|nr:response regulator [Acetobacteraceae bacterium]
MSSSLKAREMGAAYTPPVETLRKRHILLVEDDEAGRAAYGQLLRQAGYEVTAAADFRLALDTLEADQPLDLLLLDIVMPGSVNGLALARMARMRRQGLKIIYMTGFEITGAEREALGPILRKPVENARLLAEVKQALAPD